ncbi:MAG TPA: hypothetical protein VEL82_02475 [Thermoplasmata archaeon]|nr:hypothetical protein [Thermoplasmata archaeon]
MNGIEPARDVMVTTEKASRTRAPPRRAEPPIDEAPPASAPDAIAWADPSEVLAQIAEMDEELRPRRGPGATGKASPTAPVPTAQDGGRTPAPGSAAGTTPAGDVSPYLAQRIDYASASVSEIGEGLREMDERWHDLHQAAERLEAELGKAAREIDFLHRGPTPDPADSPGLAASATDARRGPASVRAPTAAQYGNFTAERYNRTIDDLKARRRAIVAWTVAIAAGISGVLVALSIIAREPTPPIWLAALPGVWLVPVPFFVVSFLATQRVLRRNHLNVATGEP